MQDRSKIIPYGIGKGRLSEKMPAPSQLVRQFWIFQQVYQKRHFCKMDPKAPAMGLPRAGFQKRCLPHPSLIRQFLIFNQVYQRRHVCKMNPKAPAMGLPGAGFQKRCLPHPSLIRQFLISKQIHQRRHFLVSIFVSLCCWNNNLDAGLQIWMTWRKSAIAPCFANDHLPRDKQGHACRKDACPIQALGDILGFCTKFVRGNIFATWAQDHVP